MVFLLQVQAYTYMKILHYCGVIQMERFLKGAGQVFSESLLCTLDKSAESEVVCEIH